MKVAALGAAGVIPQAIVDKLTRLIRRVRWLIVLRGTCAIAATAIGSLLAVMAIDASVTLFSLTTRWMLTLSAYGLTALAAVWFLIRPLAHSFTLTGTARAIEAHHPELQERISSAVELLSSTDAPEMRGSEQLIRALVEQAADSARSLQPRREVTLRAARPYLIVAATVAAIFAAVFVLWPDKARFLLTRATAPFINLPNLRARDLHVSPGDCVILEGTPLHVEVEVPRRTARKAVLLSAEAGGEEAASEMTLLYSGSDPNPRFAFTCPPATASFRYRVNAGDALSSFYTATVVSKPAIEQLDVRYEFPTYTGREPLTQAKADGDIKGLPGTIVTLTARTNKPMASAQMLVNGAVAADAKGGALIQTEVVSAGGPAVVCRFTLGPELVGKWALKLVDEHKFESSTAEHVIELTPDTPPRVVVIKPEAKMLRLPPNAPLPISYTIDDDIGLAGAEMIIEVDGRGRPSKPLALPKEAKKLARAVASETALQLGAMDLRNAKYVTFQLRATDNCPKEFKGPHHGLSDLYRIELDVKAPSFAVAQLMDQEKKLKESLEKVKRDLKAAKKESEKLKDSLPQQPKPRDKDQERIEGMRKDLAAADASAHKVAQEMEGGYFEKLGEKVKELAEEHIAKAENLAGQTKLAEEAERRGMLAKEADRVIDRSIKMVEELMKQVEPVSDVVRKAIEMNEMAQREADLAKERLAQEQAAEAQKAAEANMTPEEWKKAQEALAKEMAETLKETPGEAEAALKADQAAAAEMAKEAREMAREQQALAKENEALGKAQAIDRALGELAKKQDALAKEAAAGAASQPQAKPMGDAAKDIQAGKLGEAVKDQAAAEAALNKAAQDMAQGQQPGAEAAAPKGGEAGQQGAPQNPQQVADLAKRQGELREQTQALAAQRQEAAAEHAQGQMERLKAEQGEVAKQAGELARNVENAAPQADGVENKAAAAAGEAAKALENNQVGEAAKAANEAGTQLGKLADRLEAAAAQPFGAQPQANPQGGEQPQAGAEAAKPQGGEQPQAGAENAAPKGNEAAGQQGGAQENAKGGDQAQAGAENAAPKGGEAAGKQGGEQAKAGGENAAPKGAEAGGAPQGNEKGGAQAQAGGENQGQQPGGENPQGGAQQGNPPAGDQGATAKLAQQAAGLAERQQQLAREMQAIAAQNPVAAAAQQQAALAERAGDLAQAAQGLQQRAEQLGAGSQAQSQAGAAANELGQAQQQANAAAGQLAEAAGSQGQPAQGQPSQGGTPSQGTPSPGTPSPGTPSPGAPSPGAAAPAEQSAAQAMAAAANALEALGQSLGKAADAAQGQPQNAPGTPAPGTPGQMAQAYGSASQAAASQSGMSAAEAAGQMSQMAAQANAQAMASGGNPMTSPTHPNSRGNPTQGTGVQTTDLSESKLRELGIKLEDWARLPGELRDQILQAASDLGPEEYRPLIKRYFQQVARRGSAPKTPKPEGKQP